MKCSISLKTKMNKVGAKAGKMDESVYIQPIMLN